MFYFSLFPGPQIEPITNSTRTSLSTATVREVKCKNFSADSQLSISYYDGQECLGQYSIAGAHKLTNLSSSTKEVTVRIDDTLGNVAESTFLVNQNIPSLSYVMVSRTPKSIFIKGVKLTNFPSDKEVTIMYSCEGQEDVSHMWKQGQSNDEETSAGMEHELFGYDDSYTEGTIIVTAEDATKEYRAQCQIRIHGKGRMHTVM